MRKRPSPTALKLKLIAGIACSILMPALSNSAAAEDGYDVAAFYWPSQHYDERWAEFFPGDGKDGEWESIRNAKPRWEGHWQPRVPMWGYLKDNDPKVMEKKIEAATSHGVNVMIFDWYWFDNKPFLESALNDGFLQADNVDQMQFYLMWANHDATTIWDIRRSHKRELIWPGSVDLPTFKTIVARVIEQYFLHPSYYKIDGEPVFSIYDMNNLIKGLGGVQKTVEALDYFRAEVKKAGFPGLHLQAIYWRGVPKMDDFGFASSKGSSANTFETLGVDSMTIYTFGHFGMNKDYIQWADQALSHWPKWSEFDIPYFPQVTIGADDHARFTHTKRVVTENVNPETFKKYLLKAKAYADRHPEQKKLIVINAWNEWVEGSYLEPDMRFGMGYLEAVKDVFLQDRAAIIAQQGEPYVLTPQDPAVYPDSIERASPGVENAANLLADDGKAAVLRYEKGGEKPYVILDMGRASASGYPIFKVTSRQGTPVVRLAYSTYPAACGERGGFERGSCTYLGKEVDLPILPANPGRFELYTIPRDGTFIAPLIQGQQRYVRVQLDTPGTEVAIDSLYILNKEVHDMSPTDGHFISNDEILNKIWYASAWTLQIASFPHHNAWQTLEGWLAPRKLEKANDVALAKAGADWRDYRFGFDFEIRANPDHRSHAGWAFRAKDADNGYVAAIDLDGTFTLQKRVEGDYTPLKEIDLKEQILDGARHHVEVQVQGETITTFLNSQQIDVTTDATYATGGIGFWHPKEKWFLIDNAKVTDPEGRVLLQDDFSGGLEQWDYARTLGFVADGAKRDRLVWSGDLDWAGRNVYYAFQDAQYMRDSLKMLAFNQTPEGYVHAAPYPENSVPPVSGDYGHFASDEFSAWLVPVAWDYLLYTGDRATLREIYSSIAQSLRYLLKYVAADGLFHQRPETSKHAAQLGLGDTTTRSYMNILVHDALKKGARLADLLGAASDAAEFSSRAEALKTAINEHLWDEAAGVYIDSLEKPHFGTLGSALAMACGFATPEQAKRIVPQFKRISHGKFQSLMIRGLMEYGYGDEAMDAFYAHGWPTLANTPEVPLTTTECMTIKRGGWGDESHPDTSIAHLFTGYLLGVEPTALAYEQYTVKPVLCSQVHQASGIVPTPKGDIVAEWERTDKKFVQHLVSPEGTRATIALPVEGIGAYELHVNGQRLKDGIAGIGRVDSDDRYLYLHDVAPGSYTFVLTVTEGSYPSTLKAEKTEAQRQAEMKWGVKAPSSHTDGNWGLPYLIDGVTASRRDSRGYSSASAADPAESTWIEIDLREKKTIQSITLYPRTDAQSVEGQTAGFPVDLTVLVKQANGDWTATKTLTDIPNPKGKPYAIDLYTVVGYPVADAVRIEVTKRGQAAADEPKAYRLQLAELEMKFDE